MQNKDFKLRAVESFYSNIYTEERIDIICLEKY
jgi:hypothetical protein